MKRIVCCAACVLLAVCLPVSAARIVSVSIPVGSMDGGCYPLDDGVWSVSAPPYPLATDDGIGFILNPTVAGKFSLHDHHYVASHVPDPNRAVVTYEFDGPAAVDQIEVRQHGNGITRIEGFVGDSLGSLTSVGSIFGPKGDVTGSGVFVEHQEYVFDFDNAQQGKFFQMVIRKTSLSNGYASYQVFPRDSDGVRFDPIPEPTALALLALGGPGLLLRRRRR